MVRELPYLKFSYEKALFHQVIQYIRDQTSCPKRWVGHDLTLETPKKGSPADLPSKQFLIVFEGVLFLKSPKKGGGHTKVPALSPTKSGREISRIFAAC